MLVLHTFQWVPNGAINITKETFFKEVNLWIQILPLPYVEILMLGKVLFLMDLLGLHQHTGNWARKNRRK